MKNRLLKIGLPIAGLTLVVGLLGVGIASAAQNTSSPTGSSQGMMGADGHGPGGPGVFGVGIDAETPTQSAADQTTEFQNEASALGLSESVIVSGWAQGESLEQIAAANGISDTQLQTDLKNFQSSQVSAELEALVSAGTITQDQMTARLAALATQEANVQVQMANASGTGPGFGGGRGRRSGQASSTAVTSTSTQ